MVVNISKIKTEALLIFCRDLIDSYKQSDDNIFDLNAESKKFIDQRVDDLYKALNVSVQPTSYYIRNNKVSRIALIVRTYQYINQTISKYMKEGDQFNPFMLCFTLLSTWFAELAICEDDKEFLYFSIYPYSEIYDKMLINIDDINFKQINIKMLNIAEATVEHLETYRFK